MSETDINFLGDMPMARLLTLMERLRDKETGCPWDIEQDFASIAPYTIEEAYEVSDAIKRGDMSELSEELGDLLLQVVFHSQMASEDGHFDFNTVADGITAKMVRRHPHVFGSAKERDVETQTASWEAQKAAERAAKGTLEPTRILDGVALSLPALMRAEKLQKRAARVGFDWPDVKPVLAKINEESAEIIEAMEDGESQERLHEEVGDLLFAVTNLARHLKVDAEHALRDANSKFTRRFQDIEDSVTKSGEDITELGLEKLGALWEVAKAKGL